MVVCVGLGGGGGAGGGGAGGGTRHHTKKNYPLLGGFLGFRMQSLKHARGLQQGTTTCHCQRHRVSLGNLGIWG